MKQLLSLMAMCACSLTLLCGCHKDNTQEVPEGMILLTTEGFSGDDDTKTTVSGTSVQWIGDGSETVHINGYDYPVIVSGGKAYINQGEHPITGNIKAYYGYSLIFDDYNQFIMHSDYDCSFDGAGRQIIALPLAGSASSGSHVIEFKHISAAVRVKVRNEFSDKALILDKIVVSSPTYALWFNNVMPDFKKEDLGIEKRSKPAAADADKRSVTVNITGGLALPYYDNDEANIREVQVPVLPIGTDADLTITIYAHVNGNLSDSYVFSHSAGVPNELTRNKMITAGARMHGGEGNHVYVALTTPLSFEAVNANTTITFSPSAEISPAPTIEYDRHDGYGWRPYTSAITLLSAGDVVSFRGDNPVYGGWDKSDGVFTFSDQCYIFGNIMSLIDSDGFATCTKLTKENAFLRMFLESWGKLLSHPSKTLVLPATTLTESCYQQMFQECTGLSVAPELPATELASFCYYQMFKSCLNLTIAPTILPAETLATACYYQMFQGCSQLATAPVLPAPTLASQSYYEMFKGCSWLNKVTCLATDLGNASSNRYFWLDGVSSKGTFTRHPSADWRGASFGIPSGWTVDPPYE